MLEKKNNKINELNDRITELEKKIQELNKKIELKDIEFNNINKKYKQTLDNKEKMKHQILKMRTMKTTAAIQKLCKNCYQEYYESSNYNWSCRVHKVKTIILQSEYGEQMWWCCGKLGKDSPGCKYSKHISREDEDLTEDIQDSDKNASKKTKCIVIIELLQTCMKVGHKTENCPKEPNIRYGYDGRKEYERIKNINKCKNQIKNTFGVLKKLLIMATNNDIKYGSILSMKTLMFEDFNYTQFKQTLINKTDVEVNDDTNEDNQLNDEYKEIDNLIQADDESASINVNELYQILNAQEKNELADLTRMKIAMNSQYGGNLKVISY